MARIEECNSACRVLTRASHDSLPEAIASDFLDWLPVIGNIASAQRLKDVSKQDGASSDISFLLYLGDSIPLANEFLGLIPANMLRFLANHEIDS